MSKIIIPKDHQKYLQRNFRWVRGLEVVYISYNTGTRVLPDIYPRAFCAPSGIMYIISGNALLPVLE